jgi:AsmA protein
MKKLIKILAGTVALIVILAIAASVLLGIFINPNDYRDKIEQVALEQADLELQIKGDIGWSFYPSIGINIGEIKAAFPGQDSLASLSSANVSVMLMPLLSGNVQMKAISIEGLKLNLVKSEKTNNWQPKLGDVAKSPETEQPNPPSNTDSNTDQSSALSSFRLDIESININNADITYTDEVTNESIRISQFNLTTERVVLGKPFNASANFMAQSLKAEKNTLTANADISALFIIDSINQRYQLQNFTSKLKVITDKEINVTLAADIDANLGENNLALNNLKINLFDLAATGNLVVTGENLAKIDGQLDIAAFDLKSLMKQLQLPAIETADNDSLRSVALSSQIKGSPAQLNFNALKIALDKTLITGKANYNLDYAIAGFTLKGDKLNLNNYLPKPTAATNTNSNTQSGKTNTNKQPSKSSAYSKANIIELQPLRDLNVIGKLTFKELTYQKTAIRNFDFDINAKGGLIKIPKLNMQAYGGSIHNNITLDARKKALSIHIANSVKKLQIGPILTDFAQTDTLTGSLSTNSKLQAYGQSVHSIVNSLGGQVKFNLANGVIKGIDAAQKMCETVNQISSLGGTVAKTQTVDKSTPFANINGLFKIKKGVVSNNDFKAALDAFNATGKGSVNLPKQTLDYRLGLKIQDNLFKKSCSVNNKIQGIEWPIDCKGKFSDDPLNLCRPDLSVVKKLAEKLLKAELEKKLGVSLKAKEKELKAKIEAQKRELKKKAEDKLKDKLEGALKGLF